MTTSEAMWPDSPTPVALVVDRDPARTLVHTLAGAFDVINAPNAHEGLRTFDAQRPDIVVICSSIAEPVRLAMCESLRKLVGATDVPIVVAVGIDDVEAVERAYGAGATDFVTPPDVRAMLPTRLKSLVREARIRMDLRRTRDRQAAAHRIARLGYWSWDVKLDVVRVSAEAARIIGCGYTPCDLTWDGFLDEVHDEDRHRIRRALSELEPTGSTLRVEHRLASTQVDDVVVCQEAEATVDDFGNPVVMGTIQDVSDRKRAEGHIIRLAYYDELTGLPNRTFLFDALDRMLESIDGETILSLMAIELEGLHQIIDTFGHEAGDQLLKVVAERLTDIPERTDTVSPHETLSLDDTHSDGGMLIARTGTNSFMFVFRDIAHEDALWDRTERIRKILYKPIDVAGHPLVPTAGFGLALYPEHGRSASTLIKNVETAQHQAVSSGSGRTVMFTEALYESARARVTLEMALRRALETDAFELYYQAKVDALTGRPTGMEALLRWNDPEIGWISPSRFIPVAEDNGLIVRIGLWVLETACAQTAAWRQNGYPDLRVAVNISAEQFLRPDFVSIVRHALDRTQLPPDGLELEITESLLMRDTAVAVKHLGELRGDGIHIALDDFGTGYSSLSYLHRFPLDTLKIDRSFITDMMHKPDAATIVRAIILLSHSLNLRVVAEGVEEHTQVEELRKLGCEEIQGFFFCRPLPCTSFEAWLRAEHGAQDIASAMVSG